MPVALHCLIPVPADAAPGTYNAGAARARSHCRFLLPRIHLIPHATSIFGASVSEATIRPNPTGAAEIEAAISEHTSAIVVAHIAGEPHASFLCLITPLCSYLCGGLYGGCMREHI
jgi:hypothetical protein